MTVCMGSFASGYGIFGGNSTRWARACGVPLSVLSPQSCALFYQHGSRVEVVEPAGLRRVVGQVLVKAAALY
jgi:hypothetical protein